MSYMSNITFKHTGNTESVTFALQCNSSNITTLHIPVRVPKMQTQRDIFTQSEAHGQLNSGTLQYGSPGTAVCTADLRD